LSAFRWFFGALQLQFLEKVDKCVVTFFIAKHFRTLELKKNQDNKNTLIHPDIHPDVFSGNGCNPPKKKLWRFSRSFSSKKNA